MKKTIAFLLILVLSLCSCTEKEIKVSDLQITALNVGKADCFVITSPEANIVVDTGEADTVGYVCDYLNKNNITQIDALIISHFDKDHVGGAAEIIESYDVKAVYTTYYESKQSDEVTAYHSALEKKELSANAISEMTEIKTGDMNWLFIPPESTDYGNNTGNDSSLVAKLEYNGKTMLFTGDIEKDRINEMLSDNSEILDCDILKVPHHGVKEKNTDELIEACSPKYAIITSSLDEPEDDKTNNLLTEADVETFYTKNGDITITIDDDITVNYR